MHTAGGGLGTAGQPVRLPALPRRKTAAADTGATGARGLGVGPLGSDDTPAPWQEEDPVEARETPPPPIEVAYITRPLCAEAQLEEGLQGEANQDADENLEGDQVGATAEVDPMDELIEDGAI